MKIELQDLGKRYQGEWILRRLSLVIPPGARYAVSGPNGSGKSTFLRLVSGHLTPSRGQVSYYRNEVALPIGEWYQHLAFAAPYIEMIEEFSLEEALHFHRRFRPGLPSVASLLERSELQHARRKYIRNFSSGMKQRLRLCLAICDTTPLLLLDEPTTNLDEQAGQWYQQLLSDYIGQRSLLIASNEADDYRICTEQIAILDYK